MRLITNVLVALAMIATTVTTAWADEKTATVKKIVDGAKDSVMQVEIVWEIKVTYRGQEQPAQETKIVRNGTVIGKDGLTIMSAAAVTPQTGNKRQGLSIDSKPQSVKFILDGGKEIPAEIVLKDKDLDIMFLKPSEDDANPAFKPLALDKDAKVDVLDTIVTLSRLGTDEDRAVMYYTETINGVIEKPRKYFVAENHGPGMPAFTIDGKCFGLFLKRKGSKEFCVLPASDILESAAQLDEE